LAKGEGAVPVEKTQAEQSQEALQSATLKGADAAMATTAAILSLIGALTPNTAATIANTVAMGSSGMFRKALGSTAGRVGVGAAGVTVGVGSAMAGRELVEQGNTKTGMGLGLLGGAAGGLLLASALAPFTGGASLALYGGLAAAGGLGGLRYAASGMKSEEGDDVISSPGYGSRVLVTPTETISLNNKDTVMAGNTVGRVSLNARSPMDRLSVVG